MTVGIPPDYSDISINPRFCDLGAGDVRLSASSPLLDDPNCGLIGALGQGCGATTEVDEVLAGKSEALHAWPVPSQGAVRFSLPQATEPTEIEVYDVTGARRWQESVPAGAKDLTWNRRDSGGRSVAPGVYFARVRRGGAEVARVRVVLTD
jgi:hypothetical protein